MGQDSFEVELPPVYLEKGDTIIEGPGGSIRLRKFQDEVLDFFLGNARSLLLKAPTGSGKTLTTLLPLAARTLSSKEYYGVLAVYPTKALVEDQYLSVKKIIEKLGGVIKHSDYYIVAELDFTVHRWGVSKTKRWRMALAKLTRENVDILAGLLGYEEKPRRYVLNRFVEQLANIHGVDYVIVFAVPEYPYLLVTRTYSNPRAWKLLDKAATGEVLDIVKEYVKGREVEAHQKARKLMGGTYLGKVLYDILASLGNVLFLDEFHVWKGLEKPTVEAMVVAISTIARVHVVDMRFVFSSATPLNLSDFMKRTLIPLVEVEAKPSESGDVIHGPTRLKVVSVKVRSGGVAAWTQTDNYLPELVGKELDCLHESKRFMVIGRRNYNVEKAAEVFYEHTGVKPVIVTGVNPPEWAHGREVLAGLKDSGLLPLFGNFAVELGVDLGNIRCGIVTASTHGELVQRIGRIGRGNIESTIIVPVPLPYFNGIVSKLVHTQNYTEALDAFKAFMDEKLIIEESYEKSEPILRIAESRMLLPLSLAALFLIGSDKYRDKTYREAISKYLDTLERLWSRIGRWLSARVSRSPQVLLALASFRIGVQVKYRRNDKEDYASLSTLLANYNVSLEDGTLVVEGLQKARVSETLSVYSEAYREEWEPLYNTVLPASLVVKLGKLAGSALANILAMLGDPVYVAEPTTPYVAVLNAYGQAVKVKPVAGTEPLAYLVLL